MVLMLSIIGVIFSINHVMGVFAVNSALIAATMNDSFCIFQGIFSFLHFSIFRHFLDFFWNFFSFFRHFCGFFSTFLSQDRIFVVLICCI